MCKLLLVLVARRGCPRKILGKPGREDVSEQFSVQFGSGTGIAFRSDSHIFHGSFRFQPATPLAYHLLVQRIVLWSARFESLFVPLSGDAPWCISALRRRCRNAQHYHKASKHPCR